MKTFIIIYSIFSILFVVNTFRLYLVKEYKDGVYYKGFFGIVQNIVKF
jgi:hypothetical protein